MENRIAALRKERHISQATLADAVSVSRQTIISLESGRYNASLPLAHRIAQYFGLTIEQVFLFDGEQPIQQTAESVPAADTAASAAQKPGPTAPSDPEDPDENSKGWGWPFWWWGN